MAAPSYPRHGIGMREKRVSKAFVGLNEDKNTIALTAEKEARRPFMSLVNGEG